MKDKMGIFQDVCIPISFAWCAGDVNTAVDLPKPDLDATWLPVLRPMVVMSMTSSLARALAICSFDWDDMFV